MATTIQLRGGTASEWATANPILADRELWFETDTRLMKLWDWVTLYNDLPYFDIRPISEATILKFEDQETPTPPPTGKMNFFAKSIAGRLMPRVQGPSGLVYPLQPSFFQNYIFIVSPNTSSTFSAIGDNVTSVWTISHPVATEAYWRMTNVMSAATANITAGTGSTNAIACRGSVDWANGFFFSSRFALPDADYDSTWAGIWTRIFSWLTETSMALTMLADRLSNNNICWFLRTHTPTTQDANRQFITKSWVAFTITDTGVPFIPQKVYDVFIFSAPQATKIGWRIDNISDGISVSGETSENLPTNTAWMRCWTQLCTINAISRNLRIQRLYLESDR